MELFPPRTETIEGVVENLCAGRWSCADVVRRCAEQIDLWEPRVRAWVHVDREGALQQARERDAELTAGNRRGPLHGIPVGIKDIIDVAGFPTAAGSPLPAEGPPAREDATLVRRLREAGAIILGKTVTTQFAGFDPPVTRNPWNLERTPGGSSSGSAAAVACGMCLAAIGTQTGGSITRPAAFCGVAGCKPTFGGVGLRGVVHLAPSLDHAGPIARTVRDLAIVLDAIAGYDPRDPCSVDTGPPACCDALAARPLSAPTFGQLRGPFDELAESDARGVLETALDALRAAGAGVVDVALPETRGLDVAQLAGRSGAEVEPDRTSALTPNEPADLLHHHRTIMACEAAAVHESRLAEHPGDYLPAVRSLIEEGLATRVTDYIRARRHQAALRREMPACFERADVLVCLAAPGPAPDVSTTGDPAFNSPWSYTGLPTVSFPIGLSGEGLPLGIQLVGRPWGEGNLFRAAAWCEDVIRSAVPGSRAPKAL